MITREEALKVAESAAAPYNAEGTIVFRDVVVKDRDVSLTVIGAPAPAERALEAALRDALAAAGAETVHCRFRAGEAAPAGAQGAAPAAGAPGGAGQAAPPPKGAAPYEVTGQGSRHTRCSAEGSGVQFIAVASGKGGVGKSTVTVNLAVALARKGKRVGIIDADIYGFSVPDMMGIEDRPQIVNERVIPIEKFGVRVMSMGFFVEDNAPIVWRGPMLGKMLRNFFAEIEWGELDYLLLDLPPGTGDVALDVHQLIPQSKEIIVTTPHATAAFVAARAGAMAIKTEHEIIGIVENMSYYISQERGA